jgi:predicted restriction endonuclease
MNSIQRSLIEKVGNDNGFEYVVSSDNSGVLLASARHPNRALVELSNGLYQLHFQTKSPSLVPELRRSFPSLGSDSGGLSVTSEAELAAVLRRASGLSRALPSQAVTDFHKVVATELTELPPDIVGTEVERLVRQRVGQNKFRDALLDYWGGACAVTGVSIPEILRASHAKPWAECQSDAERLDVFNGFLLTANLDALFDRFLISFDEQGLLITSPALAGLDLSPLGIIPEMKLRWIDSFHEPYLLPHRQRTSNNVLS